MRENPVKPLLLCSALLLCPLAALGQVTLPTLFSDHAVLQREAPIHIWGNASPGEEVSVALHDQKASATADPSGNWSVFLKPEHAGGPYQLTVRGTNTITLSDILLGDVWFASGQSNMQIPLNGFPKSAVIKDAAQEIAHADHPEIRLLRVSRKVSEFPLRDQDASWTTCTPETAADFSAVAYFFGRDIQHHEHVPVGLIDSTWGGTPAEAWTSFDGLSADASLMPVFRAWAQKIDIQGDVSSIIRREQLEDAAARQANQPLPEHPRHPDLTPWAPAVLFNGMVAPFSPLAIKGVIWYQGEANTDEMRAPMYSRVFPALISDWRNQWGEGNFPFLFVQISSFQNDKFWGLVRDAQRRSLSLANTGMAVSLDVGDPNNVHPPDKQTVAQRLSLAARALAYGEPIEYSGPLFRQATSEGRSLRVWFDHAADGLSAKGGVLQGFEVAGADHRFVPATAEIDGKTVIVRAGNLTEPRYVRYAWASATTANLYNSAGLPASTFTSEDAPLEFCTGSCTN